MSLSYASRYTRRVPGSTSCVRRCVGVARAAREGLPPLGDGLRTPRRASKRASSATKAPQRSPRSTRPSSPPPRPGGTRTERRRTRPQPLKAARALDAARDLFVRGFRPMRTQLLLISTPPTRRRSTPPPRISSAESPRRRPGSPPSESRTLELEATRSRPRDHGAGPKVFVEVRGLRRGMLQCSPLTPPRRQVGARKRRAQGVLKIPRPALTGPRPISRIPKQPESDQ